MQPRGHGPGNTGIDPVLRDHRQASRGIIRRPVLQEPWRVAHVRTRSAVVPIRNQSLGRRTDQAQRLVPRGFRPVFTLRNPLFCAISRANRIKHLRLRFGEGISPISARPGNLNSPSLRHTLSRTQTQLFPARRRLQHRVEQPLQPCRTRRLALGRRLRLPG